MIITHMANQRQKGTKLAGAFIADEKDSALAELARKKGYENKAAFIRALIDAALAEDAGRSLQQDQASTSAKPSAKKPRRKAA